MSEEREVVLLGSKEALTNMLNAAIVQLDEGDAALYIPGNGSIDLTLRCEILGAGEDPIEGDGVLVDFG